MTAPPPGDYPRLPGLSDLSRLISGDRATHGLPPGTHWLWLGFPESWPLVSPYPGNYTGQGTPLGAPGDLWWFTLAELQAEGLDLPSGWLARLALRVAEKFTGLLADAFGYLGTLPLIWTVPDYRRPPVPSFQPHYRLQFGGSLFAVEGWSCRLNIASNGTLMDGAAADTAFPDLWSAIAYWVSGTDACLSSAATLDYVKFNECNALGHYAHPDSVRQYHFDTAPAGQSTPLHPPQTAIAVSLLTALVRGKAHRGRMFTPALAAAVYASTGLVTPGNLATIATAATTLLNAINAAVPDHSVCILSTSGQSNHVTQVAVGHAFDTMQTRRKSLPEAAYVLGTPLN